MIPPDLLYAIRPGLETPLVTLFIGGQIAIILGCVAGNFYVAFKRAAKEDKKNTKNTKKKK